MVATDGVFSMDGRIAMLGISPGKSQVNWRS